MMGIIIPQEKRPIAELRANAKEKLDVLVEQKIQITNKNDGRVAQISGEGRKKILSAQAVKKTIDNGLPREAHFEASGRIKELYENSVFETSELPRNNSQDIKAVHKYIVNVKVNDKKAQALLTLKENASDKIGNRIYSLELQELYPLPNAPARTKQAQQGQSNLTLAGDTSAKSTPEAIEKTDKIIIPQNQTQSQTVAKRVLQGDEKKAIESTPKSQKLHPALTKIKEYYEHSLKSTSDYIQDIKAQMQSVQIIP